MELALVTNTCLSCHSDTTLSSGHLLKCTLLNLTSGYHDNWPLSLLFNKKINPSFSKKITASHCQAMFSAICVPLTEFRVDLTHTYIYIDTHIFKYTDKLWLCFYYLYTWYANLLQNRNLILENRHAFESRQIRKLNINCVICFLIRNINVS